MPNLPRPVSHIFSTMQAKLRQNCKALSIIHFEQFRGVFSENYVFWDPLDSSRVVESLWIRQLLRLSWQTLVITTVQHSCHSGNTARGRTTVSTSRGGMFSLSAILDVWSIWRHYILPRFAPSSLKPSL